MFEVGDLVRATEPAQAYNDFKPRTISHINGHNIKYPYILNKPYIDPEDGNERYNAYGFGELEKITEENTTITEKIFHVGDIVKDVEGVCGSTNSERLGKILEVGNDGRSIRRVCNLDDESDYCSGHEGAFTVVQQADKGPQPPVVTTSIYSDGVKVSENDVEFDGKKWTRVDLKATVRRYQEILRRPVATTQEVTAKKVKRTTKTNARKTK